MFYVLKKGSLQVLMIPSMAYLIPRKHIGLFTTYQSALAFRRSLEGAGYVALPTSH